MGYWEKIPDRPKSQKFRCSNCGRTCNCIKYKGHRTVCDYKYCPYCREPMESEGVGMTREKAIEVLNTYDMSEDNEDTEFKEALALAISSLKRYKGAYIQQLRAERDIAIEQLEKLGYSLGEVIESSVDAISRQAAIEALDCEINGNIESNIDLTQYKRELQEFANMILSAQEKALRDLPSAVPTREKGEKE